TRANVFSHNERFGPSGTRKMLRHLGGAFDLQNLITGVEGLWFAERLHAEPRMGFLARALLRPFQRPPCQCRRAQSAGRWRDLVRPALFHKPLSQKPRSTLPFLILTDFVKSGWKWKRQD